MGWRELGEGVKEVEEEGAGLQAQEMAVLPVKHVHDISEPRYD